MRCAMLHPGPGGRADNGATFQGWDHHNAAPRRDGTAEIDFPRPSLRDSSSRTSNPTLKRWAIIACPSGTETRCVLPNPSVVSRFISKACSLASLGLFSLSLLTAGAHQLSDSFLVLQITNAQIIGHWDIAVKDLLHARGLDPLDQ